ncbi:mterf domain-containing protein 2 [Plakobranchus ocellatus]|uniref:Mterf domain-containing protein 2 n=1 Tax=Plakobranchus ocellatus TaxID=259542 RepID=A0AAV4C1U2_9GAST|nr:mterf domain-containing protein 2 [Plakobranchus ocellatus]
MVHQGLFPKELQDILPDTLGTDDALEKELQDDDFSSHEEDISDTDDELKQKKAQNIVLKQRVQERLYQNRRKFSTNMHPLRFQSRMMLMLTNSSYKITAQAAYTKWREHCHFSVAFQNHSSFQQCCHIYAHTCFSPVVSVNRIQQRYLHDSSWSSITLGGCKKIVSKCESSDFTAVAQEILDITRQQDVMASTLKLEVIVNLLQDLHGLGFSLPPSAKLFSGRLWLLQEPQTVISIAETILQQGFCPEVALDLLKHLPSSYMTKEQPLAEIPEIINASLLQLRGLGLSGRNLLQLVGRRPEILFISPKTIRFVFNKLKGLFTASDAVKVAVTCPNVFSQRWAETNKLFDYAFFTMGYIQQQIVKSGVLACPFDKLQDRHLFLVRAGVFVKVKKKDDPRLNPNPLLQFVVKASDVNFALKSVGMSVDEYHTFLALRELERENEEEDLNMRDEESSSNTDANSSDTDSDSISDSESAQ